MPSGTAMTVANAVISIVPRTAGPSPPTPGGATVGGIGPPVRKDQLMLDAPLAITVTRTNPSGMITRMNERTISQVAMRFLVRRQPAGSRRSTFPGSAVTALIRHHAFAGYCVPQFPGLAR